MGKGKRTRQGRQAEPQRGELAADVPMPDAPDEPIKSRAYWERRGEQHNHARLFLLNYTSTVNDGLSTALDHFGAQRANETSEQYQQRITAARLLVDAQQLAGSWKKLCAEELSYVRPSDAGWIAHLIMLFGMAWAQKATYTIDPAAVVAGARSLLGALCPAHHWNAALDALDDLAATVNNSALLLDVCEAIASQQPVATIHAAAAISGWLYSQPDCVLSRPQATLELASGAPTGG